MCLFSFKRSTNNRVYFWSRPITVVCPQLRFNDKSFVRNPISSQAATNACKDSKLWSHKAQPPTLTILRCFVLLLYHDFFNVNTKWTVDKYNLHITYYGKKHYLNKTILPVIQYEWYFSFPCFFIFLLYQIILLTVTGSSWSLSNDCLWPARRYRCCCCCCYWHTAYALRQIENPHAACNVVAAYGNCELKVWFFDYRKRCHVNNSS